MPLFILCRDYEPAVVQNARTVAKHTILVKTGANPQPISQEITPRQKQVTDL